jgi:integrase
MKLTNRVVEALARGKVDSERIVWCDDLPGLGLRMRAGGSRNWVFQYKIGAKHRRMTLGALSAVPLLTAREIAGDLHAKVRLGEDPAAVRAVSRQRAAETFEPIAKRFLAHKKTRVKPRYYIEIDRHLLVNAKPLHGLAVAGITRRDIAELLSSIRKSHSDNVGNQVRASLSNFFTWAMKEGLLGDEAANPVTYTNKTETAARDRVLTWAELREVWAAALRDDDYGDIVRLLMLTGQRREEIGAVRWSEIHFDKSLITFPPARTKNGLEHDVPMSDRVRAIFKTRSSIIGRDLVFGTGKGGFSGWSKSKERLDHRIMEARKNAFGKKAQLMPAWRLHDIRRSVDTHMNELGIEPHIVEAVLNHVSGAKSGKEGVAGIYNKARYLTQKTDALNRWATHLLTAVEAKAAADECRVRRCHVSRVE